MCAVLFSNPAKARVLFGKVVAATVAFVVCALSLILSHAPICMNQDNGRLHLQLLDQQSGYFVAF